VTAYNRGTKSHHYRKQSVAEAAQAPEFDEFGLDLSYIARWRAIFNFLCDRYWRIEARGLEHVPRQGAAVLAGTHRGFMPWDAVMALHLLMRETGRIPRFLTHPGLLKFSLIANFMTRLGGVLACQESADRVLKSGQLLGVYPEGVQGAFALYREAYQVRRFGHRDFVKMALRHRVPIIPFVNVGSAEALPVFAQIKSRFWTRHTDWPCLPISTFPFVPVPLPSKWHIRFLPPVHLEHQYGPEAAHDDSVVRKISGEVRSQMQQAIDELLRRRRSVFWGSVFGQEERE
jgi:1-acyl-sn-glycerol-3-phosphate acyltransferase